MFFSVKLKNEFWKNFVIDETMATKTTTKLRELDLASTASSMSSVIVCVKMKIERFEFSYITYQFQFSPRNLKIISLNKLLIFDISTQNANFSVVNVIRCRKIFTFQFPHLLFIWFDELENTTKKIWQLKQKRERKAKNMKSAKNISISPNKQWYFQWIRAKIRW